MGTRLRVEVEAPIRQVARDAAESTIREVERIERLLSSWSDDSELGALNQAPLGSAHRASPEVGRWLWKARELSRRTAGAFDPTIGSLVDAWDLRGGGRIPSGAQLDDARASSGFTSVEVGRLGDVVRTQPGAWIDSGAFGKGAALSAVRALEWDGVTRATVDLGGQLWVWADPAAAQFVAVAHPGRRAEAVMRLQIRGASVATSGASERWVEVDGVRIGHILDPRSGQPVAPWGSVTVVAADPLEADALATALYVMGPEDGRAWAERQPEVAALFLVSGLRGALAISWTSAMEKWLDG